MMAVTMRQQTHRFFALAESDQQPSIQRIVVAVVAVVAVAAVVAVVAVVAVLVVAVGN